jgi:hypothetical protein
MFLGCFPCFWLVKTRSFGTFIRPFLPIYIDQLMITFAEKGTSTFMLHYEDAKPQIVGTPTPEWNSKHGIRG